MTDAEPAVTVNDLARDHNRAFVEIIEKVKEGGNINAVLVDATVDTDAPDAEFFRWSKRSARSSTVLPRARSSQQRKGTARSECRQTPKQMLSSSFSLSRRAREASAQVAAPPLMESDLRQRRGAALLNKVAAFANQAWSRRCRLHCTAAARPTPAPVAPVPQVAFDPFHLVTAMNDAIAVKGILKELS